MSYSVSPNVSCEATQGAKRGGPTACHDGGRQPSVRSMELMLDRLEHQKVAADSATRTGDGWCRSLSSGLGFRYEYDTDVAQGGWEFYRLGNGICVAIVNMVVASVLPRRHSTADYLALSAVLDGNIPLIDDSGSEGKLADGFCTVYGAPSHHELETVYHPGDHLRWVTIYLERTTLLHITGLTAADLPHDLAEFLVNGGSLACRNVPLSQSASLAAHQMIKPPFDGGFRHAFLTAKALELACHILFNLSRDLAHEEKGRFSAADYRKLQQAMLLIRSKLDEPLNVTQIAETVGLTRHRLQLGFRMMYGDTVASMRDRVRMDLALDLIRDSSLSMIDIALEAGYQHPASFTRAFRAAFGVSPIQMRQLVADELGVKNIRRSSRGKG